MDHPSTRAVAGSCLGPTAGDQVEALRIVPQALGTGPNAPGENVDPSHSHSRDCGKHCLDRYPEENHHHAIRRDLPKRLAFVESIFEGQLQNLFEGMDLYSLMFRGLMLTGRFHVFKMVQGPYCEAPMVRELEAKGHDKDTVYTPGLATTGLHERVTTSKSNDLWQLWLAGLGPGGN